MRYSIPLNKWTFYIDELNYKANVAVPHTWNVDDNVMRHRGNARYETTVFIPEALKDKKAFIYFGAVYHNAKVYINGDFAGEHSRSGYTPFKFDVTDYIATGEKNRIVVEADNTPSDKTLPQLTAFDWADDGGIIRRAELQFAEKEAVEFIHVDSNIDSIKGDRCDGSLIIKTAFLDKTPKPGTVKVFDYSNNRVVAEKSFERIENEATVEFENLKLWSCCSPKLYRVAVETAEDYCEVRTGLRTIEVKGESIYLNGREIYLKGCEWMPGSHPDYGMAEPLEHSIKCLKQLKDAGCVFTRFHWQQDDGIFDWCDENGLLVQEEIPYWQSPGQATALQYDIAEQQAAEMVYFHKNHPSIICWGVGNELAAESKPTIDYIKSMVAYFKKLDPHRLVNYVSNTLSRAENTDKDDGTLYGDIAMWNDYLGLWEPSGNIKSHAIRTCKKCEGMPLVVSEFGLCEPHFKGGDQKRSEILKERLRLYAQIGNVKGYVWFSLNDYRTHMGEYGEDKLRQRIHGSTDLYGNEKPSYRLLCELQRED